MQEITVYLHLIKELSCNDRKFMFRFALGALINNFTVSADPIYIFMGDLDSIVTTPYMLSIEMS